VVEFQRRDQAITDKLSFQADESVRHIFAQQKYLLKKDGTFGAMV
jgi:hypothetical protein